MTESFEPTWSPDLENWELIIISLTNLSLKSENTHTACHNRRNFKTAVRLPNFITLILNYIYMYFYINNSLWTFNIKMKRDNSLRKYGLNEIINSHCSSRGRSATRSSANNSASSRTSGRGDHAFRSVRDRSSSRENSLNRLSGRPASRDNSLTRTAGRLSRDNSLTRNTSRLSRWLV